MTQSERHALLDQVYTAYLRGDEGAERKVQEQANVRLLQRAYQAFLEGNGEGLLATLADDVDWHIAGPDEVPFVGAARGRDEVAAVLRKSFQTVEDQRPEVHEVIAQGDTVVVVGHERGRCKPTGAPYEGFWVHVFTFRDGQIAKFREYFDTAAFTSAMRADGTKPANGHG